MNQSCQQKYEMDSYRKNTILKVLSLLSFAAPIHIPSVVGYVASYAVKFRHFLVFNNFLKIIFKINLSQMLSVSNNLDGDHA